MRVLVVGGVPFGVLVAGVGSRLAMMLLRFTSPDRVIGISSDDDFTIGKFSIGGTYNLLLLGAAVGFLGAAMYRLVRRWLIGPMWFRRLTTGLASAAVVGSGLVHADGIDFILLKPTWLAIGLFVALPGVFGAFIGPVVDRVASPDSWTARGRRRWVLPVLSIALFPLTMMIIPFAAVIATALIVLRQSDIVQRLRTSTPYGLVVRGLWLGIAVLGLIALIEDITEIADRV